MTEKLGADTLVHGRIGQGWLVARLPGTHPVATGDRLTVETTPQSLHLFDREHGKRL